MKRGKDDDKIMGPMFPRLHVNDAEKGGPRAPPRNKMALYEQLSIPTQRFNPGSLPPTSNNSSLVPPSSSSQGSGCERNLPFPLPVPPSTPTHLAEKFHARQPAGATLNTHLPQLERRKKVGDEDDCAVPVYVHSGIDQCHSKSQNSVDRGKLSPFSPSNPGHSMELQNVCDKEGKRSSSLGLNLRQEARYQGEENPKTCSSARDHSVKSCANLSSRDRIDGCAKEVSASPTQEYRDLPGSNFSRLNDINASLQHEPRAGLQPNDCGRGDVDSDGIDSARGIERGVVPQTRNVAHSREDHSSPNELVIDRENHGTKTCGLLQLRNGDKNDDVSETSMVDSISGLDISPDDVVGIIGQKHFWKARKAIVNQQRVFAVQVFELHRLIKVQQLIAGSPHLLLEDSAYLSKPLNASPAKELLPEYVVKPLPHIVKRKDDSEKPNRRMECSAENAVGKTSLSSVKSGSQPSNYGPYHANSSPAAVATDYRMGSWCFHQSPGHQWLIPIMSPSEGLIYKPYSGPGFMGTLCGGGCGPLGPTPLTANFMNPTYGMPSPLPHQGIGVIPGAHPVGQNYFPPYGMPIMNPSVSGSAAEQNNQFVGPGPHVHNGQLSEGGANFNMQHESSCNVPAQKSGAIPQVMQFQASKDTELLGSTASSPGERVQGDRTGTGPVAEGRDAHPLFTKAPVVQDGVPQPHDTDQPTKVIKVVPHNPRSATESAARIFQSIQEERKQYDSV